MTTQDENNAAEDRDPKSQENARSFLDFYSNRSVAHASFFFASVFGLVTFLAMLRQLSMQDPRVYWTSVVAFLGFCYISYYTLLRFGYYATLASVLSTLPPLNQVKTFDGISGKKLLDGKREGNFNQFLTQENRKQSRLSFIRQILDWKYGTYVLAIVFWISVFWIGSIAYSEFWLESTDPLRSGSDWAVFFLVFVIAFVLLPSVVYDTNFKRKSKKEN